MTTARPPAGLYGVPHSLPQKITPALTVRAAATTHPIPQAAPTVRLKVSLRSMLSCLLLWLRHSSRQLLCPASRFVQSSFSTLHYVPFAIHRSCSFRLGYEPPRYSSHITTICTRFQREAHSTPFRFVHSSFTQQAAVHPLPLLCSPALVVRAAGCHAFCPNALLADSHPPPFNNQPHTSKKSRQPLFVRPLLNPLHIPWPSHSSHRASPRTSASRSLLTPYLLLADSLRGDHFVRLGRLA